MQIDNKLLEEVTAKANTSIRRRMNYNFHSSLSSPCQRLLNVLLPGTIIPIHRHRNTSETYIILRGKLFVVFYNDMGEQIESFLLDPEIGNFGIHIPEGQWHTIEVISEATIFETKDGPYMPSEPEDILF